MVIDLWQHQEGTWPGFLIVIVLSCPQISADGDRPVAAPGGHVAWVPDSHSALVSTDQC
ncbi:hypothetical protein OBRU01_12286, partial [Operophtera brumata]